MNAERPKMSEEVAPWTAEEEAALAAWQAPAAPADFVQRALERADRESRRRRSVGRWMLAAAAVFVAAIGLTWWATRGEATAGNVHAATRETTKVGERAVVVVEAGTDLRWTVAASGDAVVEQPRGAAFYRVERGGDFVVKVPTGEVRVRGTCFSVEVVEMKTKAGALSTRAAGAGGAAVGALATALVFVTVYEGKVEAGHGDAVRAVLPGERAVMRADAPTEIEAASAPRPAADAPRTGRSDEDSGASSAAVSGSRDDAHCQAELSAARGEADALKAKLAGAAAADGTSAGDDGDSESHRSYDLPQAELDRMASRCELAWDVLPYHLKPPRVPDDAIAHFGLTPAEVEMGNQFLAAENTEIVQTIRDIYVQVTGDDPEAIVSVSPRALFEEIVDKTPAEETQRIFQTLSRERAAHQTPDLDSAAMAALPPAEHLWRYMTTWADRFEQKLGKLFGEKAARQMRDLHHSFGLGSRSSPGCPDSTP